MEFLMTRLVTDWKGEKSMTKDEALKMAIEALLYGTDHTKAVKACKEALEQPTQRNFCKRCGKRASKDSYHIHTCTPPQALKEKNYVEL
jgi:predicted amidophosphoribosyltransferase